MQHWSDRVSSDERNVSRQTTLSTVGIDINELIFDCGSKGSVVFRTWDFGGQVSETCHERSCYFGGLGLGVNTYVV